MRRVNHLIFDLAGLRYVWNSTRSRITVRNSDGTHLGTVDVTYGTSDPVAAHLANEDALDRGRVRRGGSLHRIGLYNPHTAEISLGAGNKLRVFSDDAVVELDATGTPAVLDGDTLRIGGRDLRVVDIDHARMSRAWAAHQ